MLSKWHRPAVAVVIVMAFAALPVMLVAGHSWGNYHWARTSNPFTLKVGDNVSTAWDAYLNEAIADWSTPKGGYTDMLDLVKVAGGTRPKTCKATAGRIEACSERYGFNGWLGLASIWASGSHITQATTKVNDSYFNTATYNTPAWRRMVMCQEIAHDFGLAHQDETFDNPNLGSCMDYTNDPDGGGFYGDSNEHPNNHDFEQLQTIYSHLDSTTTIGSTAPTGPGRGAAPAFHDFVPGDHPAQWGRLVAQSRDGGKSVYLMDFGGGHRVITVVTWTLEMAAKNRAAMGHHD